MALILNIETSTPICSVCLATDGQVIALRETDEDKSHATRLTVYIDEILKEQNITINDLDAIAVSQGPGSYTGLRIGVSTAKGLCYGASKPLIAISTLQALAWQVSSGKIENVDLADDPWFCPMIDARRMEVFTALYDKENQLQKEISADIIDEQSFQEIIDQRPVYFFGNGAIKCQEMIQHKNARFIENVEASSASMASLSELAYANNQFVDVAYFEPFYLKDFIATVSKKNILG
ncbi:MAG: tRNA (adenosine(37)-N6)-threonylcarbamoyltransferase complex dimerization subunit type 1 TsaB [Bacteroidales bacterium]|nr:tRNA (adenosine(37)-N6)-threonylcarbamoyltransferase complex dimerization subunit type 1 TsaB [Bacteroidales bacterium]MCF8455139.1 tRNA (adenosine(37)-N6)-threonylcarbamoyltransferase complex dimerization subunit type 1 TsaB [Bacteroidales bacterium]